MVIKILILWKYFDIHNAKFLGSIIKLTDFYGFFLLNK